MTVADQAAERENYARRLCAEVSRGWVAIHSRTRSDVAIRLAKYPVSHIANGVMRLALELPPTFETIPDCTGAALFSHRMNPVCTITLACAVDQRAASILWDSGI